MIPVFASRYQALGNLPRPEWARPPRIAPLVLAALIFLFPPAANHWGGKLARTFASEPARAQEGEPAAGQHVAAGTRMATFERPSSRSQFQGGEPFKEPALGRPSGKDKGPLPQKAAEKVDRTGKVPVLVGRIGVKTSASVMPDTPQRLRETIIRELRGCAELDTIEDSRRAGGVREGFSIDSSITRLSQVTTSAGELEVTCDVSMVIAALPSNKVVGMISGGSSVIGACGTSSKPARHIVENIENEAMTQAVHEAHMSLMEFLRSQHRRGR